MKSDIPSGLRSSATLPSLDVILPAERVRIVDQASKDQAMDLLTGLLAGSSSVPVRQEVLKAAILAREKLMSTGIGLGLAFPHVRLKEAREIAAAALLIRNGIPDYESMDSKPVQLAVMIIAPEGQHAQHLRLLALISSKLRDLNLARELYAAADAAALRNILIR